MRIERKDGSPLYETVPGSDMRKENLSRKPLLDAASKRIIRTHSGLKRKFQMNILLYNPDNEITNNFMPHLWMFLLKSLTPPGHKVFLVDGNAKRLSRRQLVEYIREKNIGLVGIGAMTRMI